MAAAAWPAVESVWRRLCLLSPGPTRPTSRSSASFLDSRLKLRRGREGGRQRGRRQAGSVRVPQALGGSALPARCSSPGLTSSWWASCRTHGHAPSRRGTAGVGGGGRPAELGMLQVQRLLGCSSCPPWRCPQLGPRRPRPPCRPSRACWWAQAVSAARPGTCKMRGKGRPLSAADSERKMRGNMAARLQACQYLPGHTGRHMCRQPPTDT